VRCNSETPPATLYMVNAVNPKSALLSRLGKTRVDRLAKTCCKRIKSVQGQWEALWGKRDNYLLQADDNFDWRKKLGLDDEEKPSAIFAKQNDSINIIGGFAEYMSAKTIDDLMGSEPFFSAQPEGKQDKITAETIQRHSEWRIRRSNVDDAIADSIPLSFCLGESIVKTVYSPKTTFSESRRSVMVDNKGNFVLTTDGDYIYEDDTFSPVEQEEAPMPAAPEPEGPISETYLDQAAPGQPGEEVPPPDAALPLPSWLSRPPAAPLFFPAKDPNIQIGDPTKAIYKEMIVENEESYGEPLEANLMHHRDFICPTTAKTLEDSDFCAHLYDLKLSEAKAKWKISAELLDILLSGDNSPKSAVTKASEDTDESDEELADLYPEDNDPVIQFAECYPKITINGKQSRALVIIAVDAEAMVVADYLANVTPMGKLPFHVIRPFPIRNRWYGRGYFEIYAYAQDYIERHLNYIGLRNRHHANPVRLVKRDLIKNIAEGEDIPVSPDTALELEKNADPKDAISFVEYPDLDQRTDAQMQMMLQVIQLRSGITSAAQGGVDALPQNSTATGIEAILNSGNTIARLPIRNIRKQLEELLYYSLRLIYSNLDGDEAFTYLEGENVREITLSKDDVAHLDYNVKLTMTRFRQKEQRENIGVALESMNMYIQLPEGEKETLRPMYVDLLKTLGVQDADRIVRQPLPPQPESEQLPPL